MRNTGFTLMEMLIAVGIFGGLLAIGAPSFVRELGATKTRAAVNQLVSAHGLARATAIRSGTVAELHIDATQAKFWIEVDTSQAGAGVMDTVGTVREVGGGNFVMTSSRSLVCFDGRGLATTAGSCAAGDLLVTFAMGERVDTVMASPLGKVVR